MKVSKSKIIRAKQSYKLDGTVGEPGGSVLPGDKSISHRAILFSTLADGKSTIKNVLISGVTNVMIKGLSEMGVLLNLEGTTLEVAGGGLGSYTTPGKPINCGNSATTLRLLAGAIAANGIEATLDGSDSLRRRPMDRIIDPLHRMGVMINSNNSQVPLSIQPGNLPLFAAKHSLPVASAQVKSCILLAGLAAQGETVIYEPGPSRDHTEKMLTSMGMSIRSQSLDDGISLQTEMDVHQPVILSPLTYHVPGDISAAAFVITAAAIVPGSEIRLKGVLLNPTRTGLLDALIEMGADITVVEVVNSHGELVGDIIVRQRDLSGIDISGTQVVRMIDEFPIFAIAAACADGVSRVRDAQELRHKESDRISALCEELSKIGVVTRETPDGFNIHGGNRIVGGDVDPHGDHRLAMALSVAGLVSKEPVIVKNAQITWESFPGFVKILQDLGADIEMLGS